MAVALLPPLVVAVGLFVGGYREQALMALLLLTANVICVNLAAGVATFYWRGLRPRLWWKAEEAGRHSRRAMAIWFLLLLAVVAIIVLSRVLAGE